MRAWRSVCVGLWLCLALVRSGYALGDAAWGYSYDFAHDWVQRDLVFRSLQQFNEAVQDDGAGKRPAKKARSPLELGDAGISAGSHGRSLSDVRAAETLAARLYPRDEFLKRKHMFQDLIIHFNLNVERQYGVPANHLATGMAASLAGAWAAYTGKVFPEAHIKPLVAQLDRVMRQDERIQTMHIRQKVYTYHALVGTGMWLTALQQDLQRQPDAQRQARLRAVGGEYLQSLLGVPPQRVSFGRAGLRVS